MTTKLATILLLLHGAYNAGAHSDSDTGTVGVNCNTRYQDLDGESHTYTVTCPSGCSANGESVRGTGIYSSDSSICLAAIHDGRITNSGGQVTVYRWPGQDSYLGSWQKGIQSRWYTGRWNISFAFRPLSPDTVNCNTWFQDVRGQTYNVTCPSGCSEYRESVWGTGTYTSLSTICRAAIHDGRITNSSGGQVTVYRWPGQDSYRGSWQKGIQSFWSFYTGRWSISFAFRPVSPDTVNCNTWFQDFGGQTYNVTCPSGCSEYHGLVWGTGIYTTDSSICRAAIHDGRITNSTGGQVTVYRWPGQDSYLGSWQKGIKTIDWGHWGFSFAFIPDPCNPGWLSHGSRCFRVYNGEMNYAAARDRCESFNASIAQPKDQATNDSFVEMRNSVDRTLPLWIGLTKITGEDRWAWEDGEELGTFNNWADNEPNNYYWRGGASPADCAYVRRDSAYAYWGDYSCTQGRFGVICEKEWCEFPRTARVCEHRTMSLRCPTGQRIDIISAMYGRTCPARVCGGPVKTTNCNSTNSFSKVTERCHGKENCSVPAVNSVFRDPCVGTFKYLEVTYACTGYLTTVPSVWTETPLPSTGRVMEQSTSTTSTIKVTSNAVNSSPVPSVGTERSSPSTARVMGQSSSALTINREVTSNAGRTMEQSSTSTVKPDMTSNIVLARVNVSLTLTAPRHVNRSLLRDSIRESLEKKASGLCGNQCQIGEIFLHVVTDTNNGARKKRQTGDQVINVIIQLIVVANQKQGDTTDATVAVENLQKEADALRQLAASGQLSVNIGGQQVRLVDNSGSSSTCPSGHYRNNDGNCEEERKTPLWLVGVVCAAVVVLVIIVVVVVLLCRRKHSPGTNVPGKSGNEMKNLDTPERHNHTASEGTVDNIIYNTEDEGFVDNVIYNAGDEGTVDNVIYQGENSKSYNQENAPESQYETVN